MVMSPVATAASAGMGSGAQTQQNITQQSLDTGEEIQITDDIAVWDRSILPLRADTDAADTVVDAHRVYINDPDDAIRSANRDEVGVFAAGEDVPVTLSSDVNGAETDQFAGEDVQIVIAESEGNPMNAIQDPMNFGLSDRVNSFNDLIQLQSDLEDARDLLEEAEEARETLEDDDADKDDKRDAAEFLFENPDEVIDDDEEGILKQKFKDAEELVEEFREIQDEINENVEFSVETASLDSNGELDFNLDEPDAGQYGIMVSTGDIFSESDGDISLSGSGTVIGMEAVAVHERPSEVSAPESVEPGDEVTFGIDTDLDAEDDEVTHVVGLYDENTLVGTQSVIDVQGDLDRDLTAEDVVIRHDIAEINGVADLSEADDERLDELGITMLDGLETERNEGPFDLADVIEQLTADTMLEGVETDATDDVTLNASMTAITDVGPDGKVTVETQEDWAEGEYRFVHMAVDQENTQSFETDEGAITVAEDDPAPPGQPAPPAPPAPPEDPDDKLKLTPEVITDNQQELIEPGIGPGTSVSIDLNRGVQNPDYVFTNVDFTTKTTTVTDLDITFTHTDKVPSGVEPVPTKVGGLTHMELEYADEVGESVEDVTVTTEVSQERLANDDRKPEEVAFYRHDDGSWEQLDTDIIEQTDETVTYLIESPGLSVYAPTYEGVEEVDDPGEIDVVGADLSDTEIEVSESVDVTATVENVGDTEASATLELLVDGEAVDTQDVTLGPGETDQVTFTETFDEAGEYEIDVDDVNAGTLSVVEASTEEPEDGVSWFWYVFVPLVLLVLIGVAAYFYREGLTLDDIRPS